jgi:nitrous oxide reductase
MTQIKRPSTKQDSGRMGRRAFLKTASLGVAASAGAAVIGGEETVAAAAPDKKTGGYRETDHVRRVYALARF